MSRNCTRRQFVAAAAAAGAAQSLLVGAAAGRAHAQPPFKTRLLKALIGKPDVETLEQFKAAGFDGMETNVWDVSEEQAAEARRAAEQTGMRIHSVMRGWTNVNSTDADQVAADVETVRKSLRAAAAYGADAVLWVPCRIGGMPMPEAWEFDFDFDEQTGHVRRVAAGDNAPYRAYIDAHNQSTDATRRAVERLIPEAERLGVIIALENVWNNLWVLPPLLAQLVRSFDSPWVQAYFDIGNHVKYAPPEKWITTLGKLIKKVHVKDFLLNPDGHGGKFVDIRDGSVDWPSVRRHLEEIGYSGWMTIEGSGKLSLQERSRRLDLIIAGK